MWYPFFSVPPIGTINTVLPAFIASRFSSHVSSSTNTVSGALVGVLLAGAVVIVGPVGGAGAFGGRPAPPRPPPPPPGACGAATGGSPPLDILLICASVLSILIWTNALPSSADDFAGSPLTPLFG